MNEPVLLLKQDVINGFSYSFTTRLLNKLKEIRDEVRRTGDNRKINFGIGKATVRHLLEQMRLRGEFPNIGTDWWTLDDIDRLIDVVEEFLVIFREK